MTQTLTPMGSVHTETIRADQPPSTEPNPSSSPTERTAVGGGKSPGILASTAHALRRKIKTSRASDRPSYMASGRGFLYADDMQMVASRKKSRPGSSKSTQHPLGQNLEPEHDDTGVDDASDADSVRSASDILDADDGTKETCEVLRAVSKRRHRSASPPAPPLPGTNRAEYPRHLAVEGNEGLRARSRVEFYSRRP